MYMFGEYTESLIVRHCIRSIPFTLSEPFRLIASKNYVINEYYHNQFVSETLFRC